jgi:hypothetical protein
MSPDITVRNIPNNIYGQPYEKIQFKNNFSEEMHQVAMMNKT